MKHRQVYLQVLCVSCLIAVGSSVQADPSNRIRELTKEWIEISTAGDVDKYLSLTTQDFSWIGNLPGSGYHGRSEVREFLEPFFEKTEFSVDVWESDQVLVSGDGYQAIHLWTGTAVSENKDGSGKTRQLRKYVDVWLKQEAGNWLCAKHLFLALD